MFFFCFFRWYSETGVSWFGIDNNIKNGDDDGDGDDDDDANNNNTGLL